MQMADKGTKMNMGLLLKVGEGASKIPSVVRGAINFSRFVLLNEPSNETAEKTAADPKSKSVAKSVTGGPKGQLPDPKDKDPKKKEKQYKITDDNADPSLPVGSSRSQMQPLEKYNNAPGQIDGVEFSDHGLDRLMERGIPPSAVKEAISHGVKTPGNVAGRIAHYDAKNNLTIITENGRIVTARYGK